jgi:hypothetical protein
LSTSCRGMESVKASRFFGPLKLEEYSNLYWFGFS